MLHSHPQTGVILIQENFLEDTIQLIHECKSINQQMLQEMDLDSSSGTSELNKLKSVLALYDNIIIILLYYKYY